MPSRFAGGEANEPAGPYTFFYKLSALVRGLPYLDEVHPFEYRPDDMVYMNYESAFPPRSHIANIMGDNLGIAVRDVRPDCVLNAELTTRFREINARSPSPTVVVQRRASAWTPNKNWPDEHWAALLVRLSKSFNLIEVGDETAGTHIEADNYQDLRGKTSLEEFAAVIAASDLFVGPVSGAVHIAGATGVPGVVIVGGYELANNAQYPGHTTLYTPLRCSPCWLRSPCPFNLKCLASITVDEVEAAIRARVG